MRVSVNVTDYSWPEGPTAGPARVARAPRPAARAARRAAAGESPESFVAPCTALTELGIEHVVVITTGPWTDDAVTCLAVAVPQLTGREPQQ
jgi:hypothetical protein